MKLHFRSGRGTGPARSRLCVSGRTIAARACYSLLLQGCVGWNVCDWRRLLLSVTILTGTATIAAAQTSTDTLRDRDPAIAAQRQVARDLQTATFHRGNWYLSSRFLLSDIGVEESYYAPTQTQTGGLSFGVSAPQTLYYVPAKKVVLSGQVTPSYNLFQSDGFHTRAGYLIRGDARFLLNHAFLDFYATQSDALRANTGEINSLLSVRERAGGLNSEMKYSSRTSMTLAASVRKAKFNDPGNATLNLPVSDLDRTEAGARVAIRHRTFPLTSLSAIGETRRYEFEHATNKNSSRNFGGAGLSFDSGRSAIQIEAGYGELRFKDPAQRSFRGALGNLAIQRNVLARVTGNILAQRDVDFSLTPGNSYYVSDRGALILTYAANRRLNLTAGTNLGRDRYDVPVNGVRRHDSYSYTSIGWLYGLRRLRFGFDVGYYQRQSNVSTGQNGIRTVLHLSFTP